MADYRSVKCAMWAQDEWFMDLDTDAKLLWVYLFTNAHTSVAGIYKLPLRTMTFETGIDTERLREILRQFANDGKAFYEEGVIWVVKMREHQSTTSSKVDKRIQLDVAAIPDSPLRKKYLARYSTDTVSIPYPQNASDTDTDTETDTDTDTAADFSAVQTRMIEQWRVVLGDTLTPAIFPEVRPYMVKLHERGLNDWWILALQETTGARRPGWQYMKAVLEGWLAAGKPSVNGAAKSSDADTRPRVPAPSKEEQAAADARQEAYERQIAEQLARAGRLQ